MVCVPVAFATAHEALFALGGLKAGERVLVLGAAGGVGLAAVQLASAAGAVVIATASSAEKLARLREYGASHVTNYMASELAPAVAEAVGQAGIGLVFDPVGGKMLQDCVSCLNYRGRIVSFGLAGRDMTPFDPLALWDKNAALHGLGLMNFMQNEYPRMYAVIAECMQNVAKGKLKVAVDRVFSLADAAKEHAAVESRSVFGRVVMKM